jgi:hypothetical protein
VSEETRLVVEFVGAVLVAFITFFLTRSHYERKRQDDLADREFTRRATVYDMRIKEAREVLESWTTFIYFTKDVARILSEEKSLKGITRSLANYGEDIKGIPSMRHEVKRKESSIIILNDKELLDLQIELSQKLELPMENLTILENNLIAIEKGKKFDVEKHDVKDIRDITKNIDLAELGKALREANVIITTMKIRLDKLAQTVK